MFSHFRNRAYFSIVFVLSFTAAIPADEADDALAKRYVAVVRDTRLNLRVRVAAANALSALGPRANAAVPELTAQVGRLTQTELEPLQIAVIESLGEIGAAARTSLPEIVRSTGRSTDIDQAIKRTTAAILSSGESLELELLLKQLKSRDTSVRLRSVKALASLKGGAKAAVPALTAALSDTDADVRRSSIAALKEITPANLPNAEIAKVYAADLADPDDLIRLLAAKNLGRMGKAAASVSSALESAIADSDRDVRKAVVDAITKINAP